MKNYRCNWPRGKVLGGCSVLNAMLYVRGNKKDYDYWADQGNEGWGYNQILEYFTKSEDVRIDELQNDPYHGTGGFLTVEYFNYESSMLEWFLEAGRQLGYWILDVNGGNQTGFGRSQGTLRDGLRCSTAKAFLRPTVARHNLHISMKSHVEKILIHDQTKEAYGVQFKKNGVTKQVFTDREIILSAGAVQSPQILMLSGIGPKKELMKHGIPVSTS